MLSVAPLGLRCCFNLSTSSVNTRTHTHR